MVRMGRILKAGRGHDKVYGNDGDDRLYGQDGNDALSGGRGADSMAGGQGNDTYYVDNSGDKVIEKAHQGIDKVYASASFSIAGQHVEKLYLTGSSDIDGTGNGLANIIKGNDGDNRLYGHSGNDYLAGGTGDDYLAGGKGHDALVGGLGNDTFVFQKNGGHDHVRDFKDGADKIDVSSFGPAAHLSVHQVGHDVEIRVGHDVLVLDDVSVKHIDHTDFIF